MASISFTILVVASVYQLYKLSSMFFLHLSLTSTSPLMMEVVTKVHKNSLLINIQSSPRTRGGFFKRIEK